VGNFAMLDRKPPPKAEHASIQTAFATDRFWRLGATFDGNSRPAAPSSEASKLPDQPPRSLKKL
jgi:hypothetical protein